MGGPVESFQGKSKKYLTFKPGFVDRKIVSKKLAKAFVKNNIFVNTIILGAFETNDNSFARLKKRNIKAYKKFKNTRLPRKKYAKAQDIIPVVEFLISKKSFFGIFLSIQSFSQIAISILSQISYLFLSDQIEEIFSLEYLGIII